MIPLYSRSEVRKLDHDAIASIGLPGLVLMENAGRGAAQAMLRRFGRAVERIVLLGGVGNNGGDAWVVARHCLVAGLRPVSILVGDEGRLSPDARTNWEALRRLGGDTYGVDPEALDELRRLLVGATLVVDGLLGTGLDRPLSGAYTAVVRAFDEVACAKVALDVPSGVDADTGAVLGAAPRVDLTVTFGANKKGLYQHPAAGLCGEVELVTVGVPATESVDTFVLETADLARWVEPRGRASHKGTAGHIAIVGGASGTTGAALLAGLGAMRAGAGLVTVVSPARAEVSARVVELMTAELPGTGPELVAYLDTKDAAVVGPGLGRKHRDAVLEVIRDAKVPCVLDADALTMLAEVGVEHAQDAAGLRILTPHPAEAARLLGCTTADVQADRYQAARTLAARSKQVVVLKGAGTIVASSARSLVCPFGTPALGVAGTGDVLAGVIAAQWKMPDPLQASATGVLLHALAGEEASIADRGLLASEVARALPVILARHVAHERRPVRSGRRAPC